MTLKLKFNSSFSYRIKGKKPSKHIVYQELSKQQSLQLLRNFFSYRIKNKPPKKSLDNIH